jgi:hypothetical protein
MSLFHGLPTGDEKGVKKTIRDRFSSYLNIQMTIKGIV